MSLATLSGRGFLLSEEVELKYSKGGVAYARLPLSFRNSRKNDDGSWSHDKGMKVDVTVFGALAEAITDETDGRCEFWVIGEPFVEEWEGRDGEARQSIKMIANAIWPIKSKAKAGASVSRAPRAEAPDDDIPF